MEMAVPVILQLVPLVWLGGIVSGGVVGGANLSALIEEQRHVALEPDGTG